MGSWPGGDGWQTVPALRAFSLFVQLLSEVPWEQSWRTDGRKWLLKQLLETGQDNGPTCACTWGVHQHSPESGGVMIGHGT